MGGLGEHYRDAALPERLCAGYDSGRRAARRPVGHGREALGEGAPAPPAVPEEGQRAGIPLMWRSTANGAYELRQGKGRQALRSGKGPPEAQRRRGPGERRGARRGWRVRGRMKTAPRSSSTVLILLFVWFLRQGRSFGGFQLLKLGLHGGIVFRQALD